MKLCCQQHLILKVPYLRNDLYVRVCVCTYIYFFLSFFLSAQSV